MLEVPSTDAKSRLSELLRTVERGETIAITRHGKVVAYLTPPAEHEAGRKKAAVSRFREHLRTRPRLEMSVAEILEARHEGHSR
jgi:prevent-host-death family protein